MDTPPYLTIQQRGLQGLYAAEQQRRAALEEEYRALVKVLEDLARQHYGVALERARRDDPRMPHGWTARDWQRFFTTPAQPVALPISWGAEPPRTNGAPPPDPTAKLLLELESLKDRNQALLAEVRSLRASPPAPAAPTPRPGQPRQGRAPAPRGPLAAFKPPTCPLAWQKTFAGWPELHWRRGTMLLFLLAQGLNAFMEISQQITDAEALSDRSNAVRHPLEKLEKAGLLLSETLSLDLGDKRPALKLVRLTPEGEDFCRSVAWEPQEGEWPRLLRLHEGARFPEHTAAVLAFAMNARARGWQVAVLPEVPGKAAPDVQITQGTEQHYVEVELGLKDRPAKWRNLAGLQGHVALCARDVAGRARLVGDCRLAKLSGMATDLETLVLQVPYRDLTPEQPLWLEMWN